MSETVKSDSILKFDFYFVDGDTRTQTINYGRSDVTTAEVRELQTLIRNGNLLIGDKNQATFGKISKVTHTARQTVTIPAESPIGVYTMDDIDKIYLYYNNEIQHTYDLADEITIPFSDLVISDAYTIIPNYIGFIMSPAMEQIPFTATATGRIPIRASSGGAQMERFLISNTYKEFLGLKFSVAGEASDNETSCLITLGNKSFTLKVSNAPVSSYIVDISSSKTYTTPII